MGKILKIILILLLLIIIFIAVFSYITYRQIREVVIIIQDESIKSDIAQLTSGNCSILPKIESKIADIDKKVSSLCLNPVAKIIVNRVSKQDICMQLDQNSETRQAISKIKETCSRVN